MKELWKCNYCERTDGVTNGYCPDCKAIQTYPLNASAKKVAKVDEDSIKDDLEAQKEELKKAKEAEERNRKSIEAGKK